MPKHFCTHRFVAVLAGLWLIAATSRGEGIALPGVGPINRAMGGAATAAPIDAAGALHWNPASLSGLASNEMLFGFEMLLPTEELSSSIGPFSGSTRGEPGVALIPTYGLVYKPDDSPWTYGFGLYGVAGYSINYPADPSNPILSPQPPNGLGVGRLFSQTELVQMVPTVSYAVTEKLSFGIAPTVSLARLVIDPNLFAAPDDANNDGFGTYPSGRAVRYTWGGGVQIGVYYITDTRWHFGASVKSPQWFEDFRFFSEDENGNPRTDISHAEYPLIVSLGTAYSGIENWLFALDVRYFDYANAAGLGPSGFDPDLGINGLGWSSIMGMSTGVQYRYSDYLYLRAGYNFSQNPIHSGDSSFNIASPLISQHTLSCGASYELPCNLIVSLAYVHTFENSITGPIVTPLGPVPGSSVTSTVSGDSLLLGTTVRF